MASFEKALAYVLKNEGGYCDVPGDHGGATNMGITLNEATKWGINNKADLKNISMELVKRIYKTNYWFMDGIKDQRVATKFFDMYVNRPPLVAIRLMQKALNNLQAGLTVDGVYGPKTETAINSCDSDILISQLVEVNEQSYKDIVKRDPTQGKFLTGWLNRARKIP
jgi:lysozyme family protein